MKAFLSHSSKDKLIVEKVADAIGLANVIIDSRSFDFGVDNNALILDQIERCDLFVLFLSKHSLLSKYVSLETSVAEKLLRAGNLEKFLTICLDDTSFQDARPLIKRFNAVRKISSPNAIARRICAELIALDTQVNRSTNVFVGRGKEIAEIEEQLIDPAKSGSPALFISGITGIGRRSFAQQVFRRVFPQVNQLFPTVVVESNDGFEETYRKLVSVNTPFAALADTVSLFVEFGTLSASAQLDRIADIIASVVEQREAIVFLDGGGLLLDDGALNPAIQNVVKRAPTTRHPSIVCISQRSMPVRLRNDAEGMIFISLKSLPDQDCRTIMGLLFRQGGVPYSSQQLDDLVSLADGHPHNIQMIVRLSRQYGIAAFINDPTDLISWKHRRGYEYIQQFKFNESEAMILSLLADFPRLDSGMLFDAVGGEPAVVGAAVRNLIDLNIVDVVEGDYILSPPMRVAVERDERFRVDNRRKLSAVRTIAKSFVAIEPSDPVDNSLIESGILAALYSGEPLSQDMVALTLPSQHVWLAQRLYDRKDYRAAMKKAQEALAGSGRLSHDGVIEAHRIVCLAASRLGDGTVFDRYIRTLADASKSTRDKGSVAFLRGFNARVAGHLPEAEQHFRVAYDLNLRNYSLLRELSALLIGIGKFEEGEQYARRAYEIAPDNPFVVDILVRCLIGRGLLVSRSGQSEIDTLMERLKLVEGDDMSFYDIRMAEMALYRGDLDQAAKMVRNSIKKTAWMFSAHALLAEIELKRKNYSAVADAIKSMQQIIDDPNNMERKSGLRTLLDTKIRYMVATGDFEGARTTYKSSAFSEAERASGGKEIDYAMAMARAN
jgi:tetratricopeptide (TPR) repeat protein